MNSLCTLSDYQYLNKGLVLYNSLSSTSKDFNLFYLCLDQKSFDKLQHLNLPNLFPILAQEIQMSFKNETAYNYYCWSLASRFTEYLLSNKPIQDILYIDSDIAFYHDVNIVFDEIKNSNIGILPHLHNDVSDPNGKYNVGIVYFKNNEEGKKCLNFWKDCVMNPSNPHRRTHGTCGDQKYLELFENLFKGVHIIGEKVGHGAPWNFYLYDWSEFGIASKFITFRNQKLPLVFCHFPKFKPDYQNRTYNPTDNQADNQKYIYPFSKVMKLYDEYFQMSLDAFTQYEI